MGNSQSTQVDETVHENQDTTTETIGVVMEKEKIPHFKIVLIGDPGVGKSSIFLRYVKNQFVYEYHPTKKVVVENAIKTVNIPQKSLSSITLWDVPGSEDMDLRASYFRNVDAAIVVVDLNDTDSIELAGSWKQDFLNKASRAEFVKKKTGGQATTELKEIPCDPTKIPVLLVGNKFDLVEERLKADRLKKTLRFGLPNKDSDYELDKNISEVEKNLGLSKDGKDSEEKTKETRPFSSLRGPKEDDETPECVQLLEEVEKEHGFVGSIMVSAKDGDGSADDAIQSLVRHLLTKHLPPKKKKEREVAKKVDSSKQVEYRALRECGKEELDRLFERCQGPLKSAGDYKTYYDLVLKRFKQTCADGGLLESGSASLEDCILGMRQALQAMAALQLTVTEQEGFVLLGHTQSERCEPPEEVLQALSVFNYEFSMVCQSVLRDCPIIDALLAKIDAKIANKCEHLRELFPLETSEALAAILDCCENNRARITFVRGELKNLMDTVNKNRQKIDASLLW